jgi:hypothetical protein
MFDYRRIQDTLKMTILASAQGIIQIIPDKISGIITLPDLMFFSVLNSRAFRIPACQMAIHASKSGPNMHIGPVVI